MPMVADLTIRCDHAGIMSFDEMLLPQCRFLVGPTAVGKTDISLELAERLNAEIVALDSMTVYRGMDIGTAKPDPAARARIPHHLLDFVEPHEDCTLAEYLRRAERACRDILARGQTPLFVGGTGLYLRAVLRGIFQGPPADWNIRRRWEAYVLGEGEVALHARLIEVDPLLATRLHPHDVRRVIRGLEVFESTGIPLSRHQNQPARPVAKRPRQIPWLVPPRGWLYRRIDERVTTMFENGLVAEVERIVAAGLPLSRTARQALGYREVLDQLEQGIPLHETIALIQTRTRQFAKRQHTWFRNLEECTPVEISGDESPTALASRFLQRD